MTIKDRRTPQGRSEPSGLTTTADMIRAIDTRRGQTPDGNPWDRNAHKTLFAGRQREAARA